MMSVRAICLIICLGLLDMGTMHLGLVQAKEKDLTLEATGAHKVKIKQDGAEVGVWRNKNILINNNFEVNQEGYVASAALADGEYAHDMWKSVGATSGYSWSAGRVRVFSFVSAAEKFQQINDELLLWNGEEVTCSVETGSVELYDSSGFVGNVIAGTPITFTLNVNVTTGVAVSEYLGDSFSGLKLEGGPVATPYEREALWYTEDECLRYFEKINVNFASTYLAQGRTVNTFEGRGVLRYNLKRDSTITLSSGGASFWLLAGFDATYRSGTLSLSYGERNRCAWGLSTTGLTPGDPCGLGANVGGYVEIDARY